MRWFAPAIFTLLFILFLLLGVEPVYAATYTVACGNETQLSNAITNANNSSADDIIRIAPNDLFVTDACTYNMTSTLNIANNGKLTITTNFSGTAQQPAFGEIIGKISGGDTTRVFTIASGAQVTFDQIEIADGYVSGGNGAGILNNGNLTLNDVNLIGNFAEGTPVTPCPIGQDCGTNGGVGGAIQNNSGTLTANYSLFKNNDATVSGGAIQGGTVTLDHTIIRDFTSVHVVSIPSGSALTMTNSNITGSTGNGLTVRGTATITNSTVEGSSQNGLWVNPPGIVTASGSTFDNNGNYGILVQNGSTATITDSNVTDNADGVVIEDASLVTLDGLDVSGNAGFGVDIQDFAVVSLKNTNVDNNGSHGVRISFMQPGSAVIENSAIYQNVNHGIHIPGNSGVNDGSITVINSSIFRNQSRGVNIGGPTDLINVTIVENNQYGIFSGTYGTTTLTNSIVANNSGVDDVIDISGTVMSGGFNLIGDSSGATINGVISSNLSGNPLLGPPAENGGPTLSYEPAASSRVIDAGQCSTTTDQRGQPRVVDLIGYSNIVSGNGCDIGAVERQPPATAPDAYTTVFETTLVVPEPGLLANDNNTATGKTVLVTNTANGQTTLNNNGTFTYIPNTGFVGSDVFSYKILDGARESNITTVLISVVSPAAQDNIYSIPAGEILEVSVPGVLGNDTQADGLTAHLVGNPLNGVVQLNEDGSFTYVADDGFVGTDKFTYTANASDVASNVANVVISVQGDGSETDAIAPPSNLRITGSLFKSPVILTFIWDNPSTASGPEVFFEWHNLQLKDENEDVIFNEWYPAAQICTAIRCEVTLDGPQLAIGSFLNGYYRWRVQTWVAGQLSRPSDERGFEVNASQPQLLRADIETDTSTGRLEITFPDNVNANWYQLFVATVDGTLLHLRWYQKTEDFCENGLCTIYPDVHPNVGNYVLWVQTWGPAGYGIGDFNSDEIGGWAGPINFEIAGDQPGPTFGMTTSFTESGRPQYTWQRANFTTWYQIWTFATDETENFYKHLEWVSTLDAGCAKAMTCTWTPNFMLEDGKTYGWYLQGWGPAGFASNGNPGDLFDSWTQASNHKVDLQVLGVPVPLTPTGLVSEPFGLTYTWVLQPQAAWYQIQVEQTDSLPSELTPVNFNNWYPIEAMDCRDDGLCVLPIPELFLPNGNFRWRLRAWNPLIVSLSEDQWSAWRVFSVHR